MSGTPSRGRSGWAAGLLAAAVAGALIVLAGLFLLDRAGLLPFGDGGEQTAALRERAAGLEQELAAARQAAEAAREELQSQLAELDQRVAQLAEAAPAEAPSPDSVLDQEVARLQTALAELRDQVGGASPPEALQDIDARLQQVEDLAGRVAGLAEQVESLRAAPGEGTGEVEARLGQLAQQLDQVRASLQQVQGAAPAEDVAALREELASLAGQVGDLQTQLSSIAEQVEGAAPAERLASLEEQLAQVAQQSARAEALAPAVAAQALAAAIETGRPYLNELSVIRSLGVEDEALAQLAPYADTGLPSRAALRRRFEELMAQLIEAEEPPPSAGPLERIWQSARQVVEVRPAGPQEGGSLAAVASRIEAALQSGDMRAALEEWQALPDEAQAATEDWASAVQAVVAGHALAERLRSEALAALPPRS